jgi:hypothetical protein
MARPLYPNGKSPVALWIGNWVGHRIGVDDFEKRKFFTLLGLEHRPLDRPASRCTDCTIPPTVQVPHITKMR